MNTISDIMFWISTGLLVPVIVLLILLFFRSLLLVGSFFGQYVAIRKTDKLIREQMERLSIENVDELPNSLPEKSNALVVIYMKRIFAEQHNRAQVQRLLANFEIAADKDLAISKTLTGVLIDLMDHFPCPGQTPLSIYCIPKGLTSSISRLGPSEITPTTPTDFKAVIILPPNKPFLFLMCLGRFCLTTKITGFFNAAIVLKISENDKR